LLRSTKPLGLILDADRGQGAAHRVARLSRLPAIVSWQTRPSDRARAAFAGAFYSALLRTGQADFAITEGRRAIAARSGNLAQAARSGSLAEAVSPVLYLNSSSEGVLFS